MPKFTHTNVGTPYMASEFIRTRPAVLTCLILIAIAFFPIPAAAQNNIYDTLQFTFTDDLTAEHTFEGRAGQIIAISQEPVDVGLASLVLIAPNGAEVERDTPGDSPLLHLGRLQLPADGTYILIVTAFEPGTYNLMVVTRETPVLNYHPFAGTQEYLSETIYSLDYTFEGEAGDSILLVASSEFFDPMMTLYAPNGARITTDDDSGGDLRAHIETTLTQTGLHRFTVNSYIPDGKGQLMVNLALVDSSFIHVGETREITFDAETREMVLNFNANDGDVLGVNVFDVYGIAELQVRQNPNDQYPLLATSQTTDTNARFPLGRFVIPYDSPPYESYRLIVRAVDDNVAGTVRVTLSRLDQDTLEDGNTRVFVGIKDPTANLHFDVNGDSTVRFGVKQTRLNPHFTSVPYRVTITQNGETLATYTLADVDQFFDAELNGAFLAQKGRVDVQVELLDPAALIEPVWFSFSSQINYGIG